MSREEAIEVIQKFIGWFKPDSRIYKALKMAISAMLENEELSKDLDEALEEIDRYERGLTQEPCDDAISQNQSNACSILDDECPYPYKHCWGCSLNYQYELAKLKLEKKDRLPQRKSNADEKHIENTLERQSGKWTLMYEPKNMVVCSECGKCAYMYQDKTSAFCPHCGAKMESEDKE